LFPEFNSLSVMFGKSSDKFIEQEFPYISSSKGTSSGAGREAVLTVQLSFHVELFFWAISFH